MALGAVAIAASSAAQREHSSWQEVAEREGARYQIEKEYVRAGLEGRAHGSESSHRTVVDWLLIIGTTGLFIILGAMAALPRIDFSLPWTAVLTLAMLALLATCGIALWRTTRFR